MDTSSQFGFWLSPDLLLGSCIPHNHDENLVVEEIQAYFKWKKEVNQ
jgi:hypothetical protein